ncbi:MAG TPA: hypothetical protein VI359_01835, partial [Nitrospiraceae bacterium]
DGLYTRRDPYPNIQILRVDVGERAYQSIKGSGYYQRWTESNLRDVSASPISWRRNQCAAPSLS